MLNNHRFPFRRLLTALSLPLILILMLPLGSVDAQTPTLVRLRAPAMQDPDDLCFVQGASRDLPQNDLVVVSDKDAHKVFLFDGAGTLLDQVEVPKPGNIDSRNGLFFAGGLIAVNQRIDKPQVRLLTVGSRSGVPQLKLLPSDIPTGTNYGGCLYLGNDNRVYFFAGQKGASFNNSRFDESGTVSPAAWSASGSHQSARVPWLTTNTISSSWPKRHEAFACLELNPATQQRVSL